MSRLVVGVDGGNSKTEVAVADETGNVLSLIRLGGSSPDLLGMEVALNVVDAGIAQALAAAGQPGQPSAIAAFMAGLDLSEEVTNCERELGVRHPQPHLVVDNDTLAVLEAGTGGRSGVAVICGAGINAAALTPTGQRIGFLALGHLTGDWGGGFVLGREVLWHAVRAEDGRGTATALTTALKTHFGVESVIDVSLAMHRRELTDAHLSEVVPLLIEADAAGDAVARTLVERLIDEVTVMARVMLDQAQLNTSPVRVALAGRLFSSPDSRLAEGFAAALSRSHPRAVPHLLDRRPVAGSLIAAIRRLHGGHIEQAVADWILTSDLLGTHALPPQPSRS